MSERCTMGCHTECLLSCQRALTRKRTLSGSGALEVGDLCLLEDGSDRGGALGSNAIAPETASKGYGKR